MNDEQLRELLRQAGWRLAYTYMDGTEEWTGKNDSNGPILEDVRKLVELAWKFEPTPGRFRLGDHVRKVRGSQWQGTVVGFYSTKLTPEGYAVESDAHSGAVQIYPAAALELDPL